jgi:hypothetical protein
VRRPASLNRAAPRERKVRTPLPRGRVGRHRTPVEDQTSGLSEGPWHAPLPRSSSTLDRGSNLIRERRRGCGTSRPRTAATSRSRPNAGCPQAQLPQGGLRPRGTRRGRVSHRWPRSRFGFPGSFRPSGRSTGRRGCRNRRHHTSHLTVPCSRPHQCVHADEGYIEGDRYMPSPYAAECVVAPACPLIPLSGDRSTRDRGGRQLVRTSDVVPGCGAVPGGGTKRCRPRATTGVGRSVTCHGASSGHCRWECQAGPRDDRRRRRHQIGMSRYAPPQHGPAASSQTGAVAGRRCPSRFPGT